MQISVPKLFLNVVIGPLVDYIIGYSTSNGLNNAL